MAGYSGAPLGKKLGIKPETSVWLINMPPSVKKELNAYLAEVKLAKSGALWISWPKKSSSLASDLNGDLVRELGLATGLVDIKVRAVDDDWSGLKFVYRKADR